MKARVIATGEIIEVIVYKREHRLYMRIHGKKTGEIYRAKDLDFNIEDKNNPDYWTRLEHTYAGMAMQGILSRSGYEIFEDLKMEDWCIKTAHALVQKLKEKEERK